MKKILISCLALGASLSMMAAPVTTTEKLDRGVVAVKTTGGVFVSWRSLVTDSKEMTYNLYRDGVLVNAEPLKSVTNYTDAAGTATSTYKVDCLVNGTVVDTQSVTPWGERYMKIHIDRPEGGTSPAGGADEMRDYTYTPDDISVGDVDGDGVMELFVKWFPTNQADNSFRRFTGKTLIDCYRLDGTKLWRIDLGENIRSGNHYTQFMVYDFDGDGKAEMMVKTAPGTVDGQGKTILLPGDTNKSYANSNGCILSGPEYLTVFNGLTGAEMSTIKYNPPRDIQSNWGDSYGNRQERYLAGVAYLGGENASGVFVRGYYTYSYCWAVDWDGKELKERWLFGGEGSGKGLYGEGSHSLTVGDVDGDGFDEITIGSGCVDHNGKLLYRTGFGHGDALHLTDMLPERAGLEAFMVHEEKGSAYKWDAEMRDAKTGVVLYGLPQSGNDIGRGIAANISANYPGYEYWSSADGNVYNAGAIVGAKRPSVNFRVYWDGDLLDELLDGTKITKPNGNLTSISTLVDFSSYGVESCNTTKATPNISCDLFGDWREEVILHDATTQSDLLIFTTTIPTEYKVPCLLQDRQYRVAVAWQNCAYNQPPHLGYNLEASYDTKAMVQINSGSTNQVVDLGTAMTPVTFELVRCTGVTASGLPAGVTMDFDEATLTGTVSGTPTEEGEYQIVLTTTGSPTDENTKTTINMLVRRSLTLEPLACYPFESLTETGTPNTVGGEATLKKISSGYCNLVEGKNGTAVDVKSAYFIQAPTKNFELGGDDFTIEFWFASKTAGAYMLHKGTLAADEARGRNGNWVGLEYKNGSLKFAVDDDVVKSEAAAAVECMDGEWHHIACVRDTYTKSLLLYLDGELLSEASDGTGAITVGHENMVIGNVNINFDNGFTGKLDELNIYRGAMTAARIKERYETTGKKLAYYPFDTFDNVTTPNATYGEATAVGDGLTLVSGLKGGAMKFNDAAWLSQPAYEAVQMGNESFSIEMWMYSTDDNGYLVFKGSHKAADEMTSGNWIGIERKNDYLCFSIDDDKVKTDCKLADANAAFDGNWHHIVAVRDCENQMLHLYVDGVEAASATDGTGAIVDKNEPIIIGCSDETARPFAGVIDELIIHPKALTADEVAANYAALKDVAAGVEEIVAASANDALITVVDAMTGIIVRSAKGVDAMAILDNLNRGVYIVVIEDGVETRQYKLVR